jgi:hypothetical protein
MEATALDNVVAARKLDSQSAEEIAEAHAARAELAQLRATVEAQARQLNRARQFAGYVSRRAQWTEATIKAEADAWLAAHPAAEASAPEPASAFDVAALVDAVMKTDEAMRKGDLVFKRKRQSDSDPYHPANVAITKALRVIQGEQDDD